MTVGGVLVLLLLSGCSAMCVCTESQHMRSARVAASMARVDTGEFLEACREACSQ